MPTDFKFRMCGPEDAAKAAKWGAENTNIDQKDLLAGMKANNPTVLWFAVDNENGEPVAYAPVFLVARLAHLCFNPEARASEKLQGLNALQDGVSALMVQYGIRQIDVLSKPEYGVAKWAVAHDFVQEDRQLFTLDLNRVMAQAAPQEASLSDAVAATKLISEPVAGAEDLVN
jgi:hypothetical protein